MTPDGKLLRQYVEKRDEAAFAEVVRRHVHLVYGAALRQMKGQATQAEDVAQATFVELARQASKLGERTTVAGWLHSTARFLAMRSLRGEQRRRAREEEALARSHPVRPREISWEQLRPLLDEAVAQLDDRDRDAVLLRYFENKSHSEVGAILGLSENAARMRVERALEKLREHFSRRGVTTTAALLATIFGAHGATPAPAAFATNVAEKSLASATKKTPGAAIGILAFLAMNAGRRRLATSIAAVLALLVSWQVWVRFKSKPPVVVASAKSLPPAAADDSDTPRATEPQWDEVRDFSEGLAAVAINVDVNADENRDQNVAGRPPGPKPKLWGFIDTKGRIIVQPQFNSVEDFSEGLAWVNSGGYEECIDKTGNVVFQTMFINAYSFSEGLAVVVMQGGKWGYVDMTGNVVIEPQWFRALRFSEDLALVGNLTDVSRGYSSIKWSFIDKTGKVVIAVPDGATIPVITDGTGGGESAEKGPGIFQDGVAIFEFNTDHPVRRPPIGWIDKTGKVVFDPLDWAAEFFSDGLLPNYISWPTQTPGEVQDPNSYPGVKMGYVDKTGKIVIETKQDAQANAFSEGLAAVWSKGETSYIDKNGKVVIEVPWDHGLPFSEGLALVVSLPNGNAGYIDKTGKIVIELPPGYRGGHFSENLASVFRSDDKKHGFVDKSGKVVIEPQWDDVRGFIGGFAAVERRYDDGQFKWGFIDKTGQLIGLP